MLTGFDLGNDRDKREEKIKSLYQEYIKLMYYIASGFFSCEQDVEDAVYETLHKLIENIDCVDVVKSKKTKAFVSTVATNTCITMKTKQNKTKAFYIEDIGEDNFSIDNIQKEVDGNELFLAYKKALLSLPRHYYEIIYLKFYEDLPLNKISGILSLTNATTYQRYHRAKKILAKYIEKELNNE